tara:strand:+ start:3078 stop:3818 length:741 start_codon:yes stop_codon:yes gene_type:complete
LNVYWIKNKYMKKTLIIIPTYNEKDNIEKIINEILNLNKDVQILFVDDNSPDGTSDIIKSFNSLNINLITRKAKLGLGSAYIEGFNWAINNNFDYVVQMDADLSHNPSDISKLTQKTGEFDLIIGSRYINGISIVNWPLSRLILSYLANLYARLIIGIPILDVTGGFKCISTRLLKQINLNNIKSEGYSFQIEVNFLAWIHNFKIKEVPIVFTDRTKGESKMSKKVIFEAIYMVPYLFFKKIINFK